MASRISYWTLLATLVAAFVGCAAKPDPAWVATRATYLAASRAEHDHRIADWQTVAQWTFDDGQIPEGFRIHEGEWDVAAGRLRAHGGKPDHNRIIAVTDCRWPAFRLSFDAELQSPRMAMRGLSPATPPDRIGDIGIRLGADPDTASFARSYAVILAQYANQAAVIYRLNVPLARTECTPIVAGRQHRVMVEFVKPHIRVWVDGRVVLEAWERTGRTNRDQSDFLDLDPDSVIALHTWDTTMLIDNLKIEVPAP